MTTEGTDVRQYYVHLVLRTLRRFSEVKENVGLAVGVVLLLGGSSLGSYFGAVPWWVVPSLGFALFLYLALRTNYDEMRERELRAETAEEAARHVADTRNQRQERVDAVQVVTTLLRECEELVDTIDAEGTTANFGSWSAALSDWRGRVRGIVEPIAPGKWAQIDRPLRISNASYNGMLLPQAKVDLVNHHRQMILDLRAVLGELG